MEISNSVIQTVDRKGRHLKITYEGMDDKNLAHFGGLDLHIATTKAMISDVNACHFPEKEGDHLIHSKVIALYLNEIGELIRNTSFDPEYLEEFSNIDLVKDFLNDTINIPEIQQIIDADNEMIRKENEVIANENEQDRIMFENILKNIGKK